MNEEKTGKCLRQHVRFSFLCLFVLFVCLRPVNSEAGNDEIQNFQREDFILWELHSKILVGDKNLL
jgi:hypothetical protein